VDAKKLRQLIIHSFVGSIWHLVLRWLDISNVKPAEICEHAKQFGGVHGFIKDSPFFFFFSSGGLDGMYLDNWLGV
jgi:hypothetical protein